MGSALIARSARPALGQTHVPLSLTPMMLRDPQQHHPNQRGCQVERTSQLIRGKDFSLQSVSREVSLIKNEKRYVQYNDSQRIYQIRFIVLWGKRLEPY